ncbi:MAG: sulfotransferase family protein, partial [Akkermansiaceae bacterium]
EITQILKLRKTEAAELSEQFSLADHEDIELPPPLEPDSEEPQLIVLAGFPRAGTTLLSRLLAEKFHSVISDEYPYLQQLVSQWGQIGKAFPKPTHVASKPLKLRKKTMNRYWQAQRETLDVGLEPGVLLIDKNPSLANLLPWLIGMAPGLQVIWAQRDPRDLWLSSVTLDAPVNQVNCWWQTPNNFAKWVSNQHSLSMRLEKHLGTSRFQRVDYSELVSSPDLVMQQLGNSLQINENNSPNELAQPRSPSYAEAVEQPHTRASGHWAKVGQSFSSETSAVLEDLARELCYEK